MVWSNYCTHHPNGIITPPVGVNAYIVKGLSPHIKLEEVFAGIIPFLLALIVGTG